MPFTSLMMRVATRLAATLKHRSPKLTHRGLVADDRGRQTQRSI
jgi:hypothetical protein